MIRSPERNDFLTKKTMRKERRGKKKGKLRVKKRGKPDVEKRREKRGR